MKAVLILAAALAAQTASAAAQPAPGIVTMPDYAVKPALEDVMTHYPKGAQARNVEGRATIDCKVSDRGRLYDCAVNSEDPVGEGFGEAALSLSTLFKMKPMTRDGEAVSGAPIRIPIRFTLPPAAPSVTWLKRPTSADLIEVFPLKALQQGEEGAATLQCTVNKNGGLNACSVVQQSPADEGFGEAALRLTRLFQMSSTSADGAPTAGRQIQVPIRFVQPHQ